jgi:hypothetical protein
VPTGNTDGEFKALSNALNCDNTTCMKNSIWEPTIHGLYTDSFVETGKSFYATSTYYDTTNMYDYGAGIGYSPGTQSSLKTYGFSVRCVMNY